MRTRGRVTADRPLAGWQDFVHRVHSIVRAVPRGRVVTYGQVARLAGRPRAAREVGWIAHAGGDRIPWHRVVNRFGHLASGYSGGPPRQRRALRREGVAVRTDHLVNLPIYQWWPGPAAAKRIGLALDAIAAIVASTRRTAPRPGRRRH
jgi:methylated-DNA-protein-cysteine methyltransferase-like protein